MRVVCRMVDSPPTHAKASPAAVGDDKDIGSGLVEEEEARRECPLDGGIGLGRRRRGRRRRRRRLLLRLMMMVMVMWVWVWV
jgi:hypothetical protein